LKAEKAKTTERSDCEYKFMRRYEIATIGNSKFLVSKNSTDKLLYFMANEYISLQLFDYKIKIKLLQFKRLKLINNNNFMHGNYSMKKNIYINVY